MTIYLSRIVFGLKIIKQIYQYVAKYCHDLFPKLPYYTDFNNQLFSVKCIKNGSFLFFNQNI